MTKSPFNNPRTIVCIHCQYERAINDGLEVCPECGQQGLVLQRQIEPRMHWLRIWVRAEIIMIVLLLGTLASTFMPATLLNIGGLYPLLIFFAAIQGLIGIFLAGSTFDRRQLHTNKTLRKYSWAGMLLSILLFCWFAIKIGLETIVSLI